MQRRRCTVIMVAQRLSSIRKADRILVLDKGKLVAQGTHEELLAVGGHYHRLYKSQFNGLVDLRNTKGA